MRNPFQIGDTQEYHTVVTEDKLARFDTGENGGLVHPVYSTFALARDAEWACRLFVLAMKETGEEGVGSYVTVEHIAPAVLGSAVTIRATLAEVSGNRIDCTYEAFTTDGRRIARGKQTQHILNKARFDALLASLRNNLPAGAASE